MNTAAPAGSATAATPMPWLRRTLMLLGTGLASLAFPVIANHPPVVLWLLSGVIAMSAVLSHSPRLGYRLMARAIWWQSFLLGGLMTVFGSHNESTTGLALAAGTGLAIASAGSWGLDTPSDRFQPRYFRRSILLALILAFADTQSLLVYAGAQLENAPNFGATAPMLASAGAMLVGIYGLYRLKVWGLAVNIITNLAIAALALSGILDLHPALEGGLVATAALQLLIPIPMLRAIWRGASASASADATTHAASAAHSTHHDDLDAFDVAPEVAPAHATAEVTSQTR